MEKGKIAQKSPFEIELEDGKKFAWCACGLSEKQPYCDGSHKGTDLTPIVEKIEKGKTVYFCGCKQTSTPPYCDGTHNNL